MTGMANRKVRGRAGKGIRCAWIMTLAIGPLAGVASAQEPEEGTETVQNVQLTFHLVEADGFTDDDPEISDVVSELRTLFNFRGYRLLSTSVLNVGLARRSSTAATATGSGSQRIIADGSDTPLTIYAEVTTRRFTRNVRAKVTLIDRARRPRVDAREGQVIVSGMPGPLLEASVTVRDGQRVVLGSARRSAGEPVLILIVTPRLDPA